MVFHYLGISLPILWFTCVLASGFHQNLQIQPFDEAYTHLFGGDNLIVHRDGKSVRLSLDERTGSGFVSHDVYLHGFFSASIKLPSDYTAGVVVAFYMSNGERYEKNHDEIDFEFLGNVRGREWRIQTNVYGNGSTACGREERYSLWFDPSDDFHHYGFLWTPSHILFYVDNVPIREYKRRASTAGADFPTKPMSLYATIWDASDWATNGGKYRVNYKYAPYIAQFSDFVVLGCSVDPTKQSPNCETPETLQAIQSQSQAINVSIPWRRSRMERFRKKHLTYSYCYDRTRYKIPPPECVIRPIESQRLKAYDPVTFGGALRQRDRRRRRRGGGGNRREFVLSLRSGSDSM